MPDKEAQKRILNFQTQIAARTILRAQKSRLVIGSARWMNIYQAQLQVARHERRIAKLEQARRDIIIVAVTGIASCVGSFAITQFIAWRAGTAYVTGSMAAPVYLATNSVTLPTGTAITIHATTPLSLTLKQWITGQLGKGLLISVPVGLLLKRTVGNSALSRIIEVVGYQISAVPYSKEEFVRMREVLVEESQGNKRHQLISSNVGGRREQLIGVVASGLRERVAQHISEALLYIKPLAAGLLLMTDAQRANWYRSFRRDVDSYLAKEYASWSRENRSILRNTLFWHFWNDVKNQLNDLDRRWYQEIKLLERAIVNEELPMRVLLSGQRRGR